VQGDEIDLLRLLFQETGGGFQEVAVGVSFK
jgi:hypothetical protein